MMREPSCLISCSPWLPEGSLPVLVGRHGAMNPAGRVHCNMSTKYCWLTTISNFTGLKPPVLLGLFLGHDAPYPLRRGKSRPPVRVPGGRRAYAIRSGLCLSLCVSAGLGGPAGLPVFFFL